MESVLSLSAANSCVYFNALAHCLELFPVGKIVKYWMSTLCMFWMRMLTFLLTWSNEQRLWFHGEAQVQATMAPHVINNWRLRELKSSSCNCSSLFLFHKLTLTRGFSEKLVSIISRCYVRHCHQGHARIILLSRWIVYEPAICAMFLCSWISFEDTIKCLVSNTVVLSK